jgi:hypothetical protein
MPLELFATAETGTIDLILVDLILNDAFCGSKYFCSFCLIPPYLSAHLKSRYVHMQRQVFK